MFEPTATRLTPELTPREELTLLARTLWVEGYSDHLAGHITFSLGDGTYLCNPWFLTWDEFLPSQVIRIDSDARVIEGEWPAPPGIPLHLAVHKHRPGVAWVLHNHPLFGTLWADLNEVPSAMDQSSAQGGAEIALVPQYDGGVNDPIAADNAVRSLGDREIGLLRGHGVVILADSAAAIYQRATALEIRCQRAWYLRCAGSDLVSPVPEWWMERQRETIGSRVDGIWAALIRRALRAEPSLINSYAEI